VIDMARIASAPWGTQALADGGADQVTDDPHVKYRRLFFEIPHPTTGKAPLLAIPIKMSETPVDPYVTPTTISRHNDDLHRDWRAQAACGERRNQREGENEGRSK
jgi:crotonobetainyl-CoA:carnitine CoA-transferase CaiB-like acyl-CoA transferase